MSALQALDYPKVSSIVLVKTISSLNKAGQITTTLELQWVRAHDGTLENELADLLAKRGTELVGPPTEIPVAKAYIKTCIKKFLYKDWKEEWVKYPHARLTKQFYGGPAPNKAKCILRLCRADVSRMVTLLTGHNDLAYFSSLVNNSENPSGCSCLLYTSPSPRD